MKKTIAVSIILLLGALAALIPGCDELVTKEITNNQYDTIKDSTCVVFCHSDISNDVTVAKRQWLKSGHSSDSLTAFTYYGQNTRLCGEQCHSTEGFVRSLGAATDSVNYPTEIGCYACHKPHTTWDFALRDTAEVSLTSGANYNRGKSNICARCHHSIANPALAVDDSITIALPFGPHGSPQTDMLAGTGGYNYADTAITRSAHSTSVTTTCLICHMEKSRGFSLGGHSARLSDGSSLLLETCNRTGCHTTKPVDDFLAYDSVQVAYIATIDSLRSKLIEANLIDSSDIPITRFVATADSVGALFNYLFVINDGSHGVHNTRYGLGLMRQSLAYLNIIPVP